MDLGRFPRARFAHLPTPFEPLAALSRELGGPTLWVKRDDCTGLATGGNKTRKLEFLVADALREGADTLVTEGGVQSNHCRQTAAAAAHAGLECELVLQRSVPSDAADYDSTGNVLLERLLGARVHFVGGDEDRGAASRELTSEIEARGGRPYRIPTGGSNAIGGLGYAACALELVQQAIDRNIAIDAVVVASGSGGTQGGLLAGFAALSSNVSVFGVDVTAFPDELREEVRAVADGTGALLGVAPVAKDRLVVETEQAGRAYGVPTAEALDALRLAARLEGLLLDPVYSAKAFAGLLALVKRGFFTPEQNVVFLHTGGTAALPAYREVLARSGS